MSPLLPALWRRAKSHLSHMRRAKSPQSAVDREAQRVAAAFGVQEWTDSLCGFWDVWRRGQIEPGVWLEIEFDDNLPIINRFIVGEYDHERANFRDYCLAWTTKVTPSTNPLYNALMMRGLYCLGFEDEMLVNLNSPLTAHEQLELRLSFPREFWPKAWLEEP